MAQLELEFLNIQRDRNGWPKYYYFRRAGRRWSLPGAPLSEEFMEEYRRLLKATDPNSSAIEPPIDRRSYSAGSFGTLVNDYLDSAAFKDLGERTKKEYRRVLEALQEDKGHKPVRHMRRRHVRKMRDARAETPGAANTILRMLKIVLNFAVDEEWIDSNPAAKMKELKVGEWRDWTDDECAQFEKRWAPGTMQRRAYMLACYTGQRKSDQVLMTRGHRKAEQVSGADSVSRLVNFIRVKQGKTNEEVWIPEHKDLTVELERGEKNHLSLLTTSKGKAFDGDYFGAWFAEAIEDAGLPDDCVLHGLRKTATRKLADAGCTELEIMSITGHTTSRMVSHYAKTADKRKRASAAILKLENAK